MYYKIKEIMDIYKISRSTACRMIKEMQQSKRYPAAAIVGGTCKRINGDAFQDFIENREALKHPNMKKYLKPYKGGGK